MPSVYHLLSRQIPSHIIQQYPIFCKFIEYYYRWLQTRGFVSLDQVTNIDSTCTAISIKDSTTDPINYLHHTITNGTALAEVVGIDDDRLIVRYLTADATFATDDDIHVRANSDDKYTDEQQAALDTATISNVETLPSAFIEHFSRLLDADQIFGTQTANIGTILRTIRQLYQSKGNEQALKYLIKALKGADVEIRYPWDQVLKVSDGKWKRQYCITVRSDERYWHYVPLNMTHLRLMYNDTDEYGNQRYRDYPITKIEIFGKQSENYDQSASGELKPFTYDLDDSGFDNGYWMNIVDFETLIRYCYDNNEAGFDNGSWLSDDTETYEDMLQFMYDNENQGFDIGYWLSEDSPIGNDLFSYEVNQYDDFGPYWIRDEHPELGPYEIDPTTGGLLFEDPKANCTYGRWGHRYVTPFIRFYFEEDVRAELDQEVRVIEQDENGDDYVSYVGNVVLGVSGVKVVNPGKGWQVGQVFTASKDNVWYLYSEPIDSSNQRSVTLINQDGINVEYSIDKPLIGRVLTIDKNGGIETIEILQYGDHIPEHGGKPIVVSPLFYDDPTIDETEYQATLQLTYDANPRGVGYFDDPSGFLSYNDIRLQDSNYWQQFSYDIVSTVDGDQYQSIAELLHPAGTKMFTTYNVEANLDAAAQFDIDQTYPFVSISLFDVAYATEKLEKTFLKSLKETMSIDEFLDKTFNKALSDVAVVNDGHNDNTLYNQIELNYDCSREQYQWIERTVDVTNHVKTSYADSGWKKLVHLNYDYHIIDDFLQNPYPDVTSGGYVIINECDGLVWEQRARTAFVNKGDTVTLVFSVTDQTRYSITDLIVTDVNYNPVDHQHTIDNNVHTCSFVMPAHDVIIDIVGETIRYRVVTRPTTHGTITPSQSIGFEGDTIIIDVVPENDQWALGSLFYNTPTLGTVYITDERQFTLPNEDTEVGGTFVSDGGYITVENVGNGVINWNVDITKFIKRGTVVSFETPANNDVVFQNAQIINNDGTTVTIVNNTFTMPANDVLVRVNFAVRQRSVQVIDNSYQTDGSSIQAKATLLINPPAGLVNVGTEVKYSLTPATAHDGVIFLRKTENNVTTDIPLNGSFIVGDHDITITYALKRTGGYLKYGEYVTSNFQPLLQANVEFNKWVPEGTPLHVRCVELEGYKFNNYRYFETDGLWRNVEYMYEAKDNKDDPQVMPPYDLVFVSYEYQANEYNISLTTNNVAGASASYTIEPSNIAYGPETPTTEEPEDPNPPAPQGKVRFKSLVQVSTTVPERVRVKSITYSCNGTTYDITDSRQFYALAGDVVIDVQFEQYDFDVTVNQSQGGTLVLNPAKTSYQLGDVVRIDPIADPAYELVSIHVRNADGTFDVTDDRTFTVTSDTTINVQWKQSIYTLTTEPPELWYGQPTEADGSLQSILQSHLVVQYDNQTINGPVYGQDPIEVQVPVYTLMTISFVSVAVDNPELPGIKTSWIVNNVSVGGANYGLMAGGSVNVNMPHRNITCFGYAEKKYSR